MPDSTSAGQLEAEIVEADRRARAGRLERLVLLRSFEMDQPMPIPALVSQYVEEARLCWYVGAFVATILMVQVAFEEWFRSYYRAERGGGAFAKRVPSKNANTKSFEVVPATGNLDSGRSVERAGFEELLQQALSDDLITREEFGILDGIRKTRIPYEHTRSDRSQRGPSFFDQLAKICVPEVMGKGVEDEAREAVVALSDLLPKLCLRLI